jgi:hypothetical protein
MVFQRVTPEGVFVAWGEENEKENSYVVSEGKKNALEGLIANRKESETYGYVFDIRVKISEKESVRTETVIVPGTTKLLQEMGYFKDENKPKQETNNWHPTEDAVTVGEVVRIIYKGKTKVKHGREMYDFKVLVDRK